MGRSATPVTATPFHADADGLTIGPGPQPVTLGRQELAQLGLQPRDDFQIPLGVESEKEDVTGRILSALHEAILRCRGPVEAWMVQDLKRGDDPHRRVG